MNELSLKRVENPSLRGLDESPAHHGKTDDDSFAAILAGFNQALAACLGPKPMRPSNWPRLLYRHLVCGTFRKHSANVCE
jgi:hypothetical protein